mmetsp:Transcript_84191/g.212311  ORF Transcript_84191/g.212311 Transcript_84191/m.212311 type:complete len:271 (+) Transcript_84191:142-954(+)
MASYIDDSDQREALTSRTSDDDDNGETDDATKVGHGGRVRSSRASWTLGIAGSALALVVLLAVVPRRLNHKTLRVSTDLDAGFVAKYQEQSSELIAQESSGGENSCSADEEYHMGLCYDKCNILTSGQYPFRQSAWTCCKAKTCSKNPFQLFSCCSHNMGFCSGYDIAGMLEGHKVCPHKPGVCLADEELFMGICYKKCALLTEKLFPYRVGPASCCKRNDASCIIQEGVKDGLTGEAMTKASFDVGGGCDDGVTKTPCKPHPPETDLTR